MEEAFLTARTRICKMQEVFLRLLSERIFEMEE